MTLFSAVNTLEKFSHKKVIVFFTYLCVLLGNIPWGQGLPFFIY